MMHSALHLLCHTTIELGYCFTSARIDLPHPFLYGCTTSRSVGIPSLTELMPRRHAFDHLQVLLLCKAVPTIPSCICLCVLV